MKSKMLVLFILMSLCKFVHADDSEFEGSTGPRNISNFGCHVNDGTCYFDIDGEHVGHKVYCLKNNVRFSKGSANGDTWITMLLAAQLANKKVVLNISGCHAGYPTFNFGHIVK